MTTDPPLLNYVEEPKIVYITTQTEFPSVATLTIGVINSSGSDITVSSLQFTPTDLTQVAVIGATCTSPDWAIAKDTLRAVPNPGHAVMHDGDSVSFQIKIQIDDQEGTGSLSVLELASTDAGRHRGSQTWLILKVRSPTEVHLSCQPAVINPGDTATLSWTTVQAETCFLYSAPIGVGNIARAAVQAANGQQVDTNGQMPVSPATTTVYTLIAHGLGPDQSSQVTLGVLRVVISARLDPPNILEGESSTLSWTISNATSATLSPPPPNSDGKIDPIGGTLQLSPSTTTPYTITATGNGTHNISQYPITLSVTQKAFINNFFLVRYDRPTQNLTLQWDAGNATQFTIVAPDVGYQLIAGANIRTVVIQIPDGVYAGLLEDGKNSITFTLSAVGAGSPQPFNLPVQVL